MSDLADSLLPKVLRPVQEVVQAAGVDVSSWSKNLSGFEVEENKNVYKNFLWAFGGGAEPIALCVWHNEIDWNATPPLWAGNLKAWAKELTALGKQSDDHGVKSRVGIKARRAHEFQQRVWEGYKHKKAIRVILLAGQRTVGEKAATDSSKVHFRDLDPQAWYVHEYDAYSGEFKLVRGLAPPVTSSSPLEDTRTDPVDDPGFQALLGTLDESEREALIKARAGQGPFRDALVKRWGGCSVTGLKLPEFLVASHIVPWSKCTTKAQRLGDSNGLLLLPHLDRAFDRGFITFDDTFKVKVSPCLASGHMLQLHIDVNMKLRAAAGSDLHPNLLWHRENVFRS